jgi:hypothetical protein
MTAKQRRYFGKQRIGRTIRMAKRRRKRSGGRRRAAPRRGRRSRGHGGGGSGLSAVKHDVPRLIAAGIYGKLEAMATADTNNILNKVPKPLVAVGYTGNIALALYAATYLVKHPYVRLGASVVATIAAYKMGKNGGAFTSSTTVGAAYDGDSMDGDEKVIDDHVMGALDAEAKEFSSPQQGLSYDDVVKEAGSRV